MFDFEAWSQASIRKNLMLVFGNGPSPFAIMSQARG